MTTEVAALAIPPSATKPVETDSEEPTDAEPEPPTAEDEDAEEVAEESIEEMLARREQEQFEAAEEALLEAIESVPALEALQDSLLIEQTPEGLRIQLIDQSGLSMFASGSAKPNEQLVQLIGLVTQVVTQLPNKLSISSHTDSVPYRSKNDYTNWELSSGRANAARRGMVARN